MIDHFDGDYSFLSNFYPAEVAYEGVWYYTVEHAFQAAKTLDLGQREVVRKAPTPAAAKKAGRSVTLRPDWESVKVQVMEHLVRQKFNDHDLRKALLATGNEVLVEGNYWNDTFWGVCRGKGQNHLGRILMKVRDRIREKAS